MKKSILFSSNRKCPWWVMIVLLMLVGCSTEKSLQLITIADARHHPAQWIDAGEAEDSSGDVLVFDQPLLDKNKQVLGNNSGFCLRTRTGHSFQCQWTLSFEKQNKTYATIQVAGREFDQGQSSISIVGGTGKFSGIRGEMTSTNNNDGTFTQILNYTLNR